MTNFWLENPNILLNKNYITEIWPNSSFDLGRKLNAITRIIIIMAILGYFLTKSHLIPVSAFVSLVVLVIIYKSKSSLLQKEGFKSKEKDEVESLKNLMHKEFTVPEKNNPVMNVLMNEYKEKDYQIKLIDKITSKAIKQVEKERGIKARNYISEWFRYVELVSEKLNKYLN